MKQTKFASFLEKLNNHHEAFKHLNQKKFENCKYIFMIIFSSRKLSDLDPIYGFGSGNLVRILTYRRLPTSQKMTGHLNFLEHGVNVHVRGVHVQLCCFPFLSHVTAHILAFQKTDLGCKFCPFPTAGLFAIRLLRDTVFYTIAER